MASSSIEWTEMTWNPTTGCSKVSSGCKYCYAEVMSRRLQAMGLEKYKDGFEVILVTTAPYFWGFLGLTIMSMVVLRMKTSKSELTNEKEGVYRVPLFPLPAIFFFVVCGALVYSSIGHVNFKEYWLAFGVVTALMGIGIVLGFILTQKRFTSSE